MSFLSKLSKPKYKGKVGNVPMFDENGELIDSGAEAGGGGELTPEALSEVLEGSDSVVVDLNEEGDKLQVRLDQDAIPKLYRIDGTMTVAIASTNQTFYFSNICGKEQYNALNPSHSTGLITVTGAEWYNAFKDPNNAKAYISSHGMYIYPDRAFYTPLYFSDNGNLWFQRWAGEDGSNTSRTVSAIRCGFTEL